VRYIEVPIATAASFRVLNPAPGEKGRVAAAAEKKQKQLTSHIRVKDDADEHNSFSTKKNLVSRFCPRPNLASVHLVAFAAKIPSYN
jgi:hypothetical protein